MWMTSCSGDGDLRIGVLVSFFFFKQKTAYEMRISDWSSDVCSSDLIGAENTVASLAPGAGISGWLDRQLLPGLILRGSWDPEGILSTLPSMASGFLGVALARWASAPRPIWRLAFAGILLVLTGLLTTIVIPINKDLWTERFLFVTSGKIGRAHV